jgi:hypothetical protein
MSRGSLGRRASRLIATMVLVVAWSFASHAQASKTRNAAILARALSFELTLDERVGSAVTIAVIYKGGDRRSEANADEWIDAFRAIASVRIKDRPLSAVKVAYTARDATNAIDHDGADVLLVADGLTPELQAIAQIARSRHVLTAGNNLGDVAKELTLCITDEGDKVKIVVNLNAGHLEGIRFSSNLLKLATLIR